MRVQRLPGFRSASMFRYPSLRKGLVGAWINPYASPSGETEYDFAGRHNDGTLTSMDPATDRVTARVNGRVVRALDFDGLDDYLGISQAAFPSGASARTELLWFQARAFEAGADATLIGVGANASSGRDWIVSAENNAVSVAFDGHRVISPKSALVTGQWYHLAVRVPNGSTSTSQVEIWIDGLQQILTDESGSPQTLNTIDAGRNIGAWLTGRYFDGRICDVLIYNRAISATEIKLLSPYPGIAYELRDEQLAVSAPAAGGNPWYYYQQQKLLAG